jgi:ABC-2 type transport system permease protein
MWKNSFNLTKIFLISSFGKGGSKKKNGIGKILLYGILIVYLIGVFAFLSYEILTGLMALEQQESFIGFVLMAIITLVLFTTVISTMNVLYFSKDNRFILPLPLRPVEVLSAKINTLLAYVYLEEMMLGLAPLLMYGILTKQSILYYPLMILVLLLLPMVPLLIVAFIVICIMALTGGIRNKSLVQLVTMTLSILFSLIVSMLSSSMSSGEDVMALMDTAGSLVEIYKKAFPTMPMAIETLTGFSFQSLILLAAVSLIFYLLVCVFAQKLYYRGMLGSLYSSSGVSNKKLDEQNAYRSKGLFFSYVMKELRVYLRKPVFFVQLILPCLILPAFTIGITYFSIVSQLDRQTIMEGLSQIYASRQYDFYIFAIVAIAAMFLSMYSFISTVAVSKDGHDAYAMKYLPVPFHKQLTFKMIPDIVMCLFSYLVVGLMAMILFRLPLRYLLLSLPVAVLYSILHGFLILSDVRKPKLEWTNEMQIVKKNLRMILGMAFSLLNMGLVAVIAFIFQVGLYPMIVLLIALYLITDLLLYRYICRKGIALAEGFE